MFSTSTNKCHVETSSKTFCFYINFGTDLRKLVLDGTIESG